MARRPLALASRVAVLLLALHVAAGHLAPSRFWGFAAPAFVPRAAEFALAVIALLLAIPPVATSVARRFASTWMRRLFAAPGWWSAAAVALFIALRSRNHFLGDGFFRIAELASDRINLRSADFLDLFLHRETWRALRHLGFHDPSWSYVLLSALSGAAVIALLPALASRVVPAGALRWTVPAFLLTMGSAQLFFGYVECYSLREAAIVLYYVLALRALEGHSRIPATASLLGATLLHLSSLALAPSLLALYLDRNTHGVNPRRTAMALGWVSLAVTGAVTALYAFRHQYGGFDALLPLTPSPERAYSLFSPRHAADLANFVLLIAPVGALLLLAGLSTRRLHELRRDIATPHALFWFLAGLGPLALVFFLDPQLGCRDWDLMAILGTPVTLAGVKLVFGSKAPRPSLGAVAAVSWGVSLFHAGTWVLANHDFHRSAAMVLAMVDRDPHHLAGPHPRLVNLAVEFDHRGFKEEAYALHRKAIAVAPQDFWAHYNLGTMLLQEGRWDEAASELREAVRLDPGEVRGHTQLGTIYGMMGRFTESQHELREAVRLAPDDGNARLNLGLSCVRGGAPREGVKELETARRLLPPDFVIEGNLAAGYADLEEWALARSHAEEALRLHPRDRGAWLILGESRIRLGEVAAGRAALLDMIAAFPGTEQAARAQELLRE